jgi:hypothetical protein
MTEKPLKFAGGLTLRNGQLIRKANVARDGAEKRPHVPETAYGMKTAAPEHVAGLAQNFSNPLDDSKLETKPFLDGRSEPAVVGHAGRTSAYDRDIGSAVLNDAVMPSRK